ncbi:50S ribosomal protein L5 [Candidatus Woesearchaeota archaeon]|nr:50S ribosomal protein L5 [Candidatus Woesearchaeota archaeon]
MNKDNKMREIKIEKVTLNFGAGKDADLLDKGVALIKMISGKNPVKTVTTKRIPEWGLRPGLPLGCKITLRGNEAETLLLRLMKAKDNNLKTESFGAGNFSFGIPEYIDIQDVKYMPELGIIGFEVAVTLKRPGFRIKYRKKQKQRINSRQSISKEETIQFAKEKLKIQVGEEQ